LQLSLNDLLGTDGRRQKAEGRRQKAEGRRQKAEGRRQYPSQLFLREKSGHLATHFSILRPQCVSLGKLTMSKN
jgi:hypothetical protein